MRKVAFAAARSYFAIAILLVAMYATSFIAAYLLPAAVVAFAACLLFLGAAMLWPSPKPKPVEPTSEDTTDTRLLAVRSIRERASVPSKN